MNRRLLLVTVIPWILALSCSAEPSDREYARRLCPAIDVLFSEPLGWYRETIPLVDNGLLHFFKGMLSGIGGNQGEEVPARFRDWHEAWREAIRTPLQYELIPDASAKLVKAVSEECGAESASHLQRFWDTPASFRPDEVRPLLTATTFDHLVFTVRSVRVEPGDRYFVEVFLENLSLTESVSVDSRILFFALTGPGLYAGRPIIKTILPTSYINAGEQATILLEFRSPNNVRPTEVIYQPLLCSYDPHSPLCTDGELTEIVLYTFDDCSSGCAVPTRGCFVKANVEKGIMLYYLPGSNRYDEVEIDSTKGELWFCTKRDAEVRGWKPNFEAS